MTFGFTKDGGKLVSEQRTGDLSYNFKGSSLLQKEWGAKMKAMSPEILNGLMSFKNQRSRHIFMHVYNIISRKQQNELKYMKNCSITP